MQHPHLLLSELDRLESLRDTSRDGQRQFKRFVIRGDAELHPMGRNRMDTTPIEVKLRDIGRGGVGFICSTPLPTNSSWRAMFVQNGYVVGEQAAVVRHCREVSDGVFLIGTQFVANSGLLTLLGVPAGAVDDTDEVSVNNNRPATDEDFVPPAEVA